jgi:peptidyl-tRNA hydrolase, PTH1 family
MWMIVGLGNPGPKYETTRHNVGFLAIDRLIESWRATGPNQKSNGDVYQASLGDKKVLLVKPQTYMNLSGQCVGPLFSFYKCKPEDLIVIHDDLDLKPLTLRIKTGGGTGGHNGLRSIDEHLGAGQTGYHRIRIGIGKPSTLGLRISPVDFVLSPLADEELVQLDTTLDLVKEAAQRIIQGNIQGAMTEFNH